MKEFKSKGFFNRGKVLKGVALMLLAAMLVACGDSPTNTTAPVATTTASAATTSAAGNSGANSGTPAAGGQGGQGRGNFNPPVSGTVQSFDAAAKTLTVKAADGTSQTYDTSTTRVVKTTTITSGDLAKLATGNMVVQVLGDKGSDGSYNATRIVLVDPVTMGGPGGQFGGGRGGQGQPPANGTPSAGQPPVNGTPGAGGQPGFGGGRGGLIISNPVVSGTTITGTDFSGAAVTVNFNTTTVMIKRDAGALTDLKIGETVSVTARPAQSGTTEAAITITIGE